MLTRTTIAAVLLLLTVAVGCDNAPDTDFTPIMTPIENRDAEANVFRDWEATEEQLASLAATKAACTGRLTQLLEHAKWSGNRLRVTGFRDGLPVTQDIGPWHIVIVPTAEQSVVEIKGLLFAKGFSVKLDVNRDVLVIKETEFAGKPLSGKSPLYANAAFQGVGFESELGLVMGSASILFLEDGRVSLDFSKVMVNGAKAGEYGVLEARVENR